MEAEVNPSILRCHIPTYSILPTTYSLFAVPSGIVYIDVPQ